MNFCSNESFAAHLRAVTDLLRLCIVLKPRGRLKKLRGQEGGRDPSKKERKTKNISLGKDTHHHKR